MIVDAVFPEAPLFPAVLATDEQREQARIRAAELEEDRLEAEEVLGDRWNGWRFQAPSGARYVMIDGKLEDAADEEW